MGNHKKITQIYGKPQKKNFQTTHQKWYSFNYEMPMIHHSSSISTHYPLYNSFLVVSLWPTSLLGTERQPRLELRQNEKQSGMHRNFWLTARVSRWHFNVFHVGEKGLLHGISWMSRNQLNGQHGHEVICHSCLLRRGALSCWMLVGKSTNHVSYRPYFLVLETHWLWWIRTKHWK